MPHALCPLLLLFLLWSPVLAESEAEVLWTVPPESQLRADLLGYLNVFVSDEILRNKVMESWSVDESVALPSAEILTQRVLDSLRTASPEIAAFLNLCDAIEWTPLPFGQKLQLPEIPDHSTAVSPRLTGTLRMYLAERLIRAHYYDEALMLLREMNPENTIDPIIVLFCLGIAHNELLNKREGLLAMKQLRDSFPTESPYSRRFAEVAKLLENELKNIDDEEENPENIARRMEDVQRRLGQGNTDDGVQKVEKDVLDSLEKLIEKLEERQKRCQSAQGGQGNKPAGDSRIMRQKGPGNVGEKNVGDQSGWGELPAKQREAALMQIEQEFPPHYRDIIEQYFRQMAR
ncbi:MAG: hypothetical protein FWC43_03855 [Planctomycetaceae bacterium]|nr:hypothetical protein [Planctomycetaceae bacterium]